LEIELSNCLGIAREFIGDTMHLKAESDSVFFDKYDGTTFTFKFENDSIMGFIVDSYNAKRVE